MLTQIVTCTGLKHKESLCERSTNGGANRAIMRETGVGKCNYATTAGRHVRASTQEQQQY